MKNKEIYNGLYTELRDELHNELWNELDTKLLNELDVEMRWSALGTVLRDEFIELSDELS